MRSSPAPDSHEIPIRFPLLLATTAISSLLLPAKAPAQANQGSIAVSAIILPAPPAPASSQVTVEVGVAGMARVRIRSESSGATPAPTTFIRLSPAGEGSSAREFVAQVGARGAETILPMPCSLADHPLRLQRLILAGT